MINLHFFSYIHCIFQENKTKQKKLFCELLGKKGKKKKNWGPDNIKDVYQSDKVLGQFITQIEPVKSTKFSKLSLIQNCPIKDGCS